ncbi:MAG: tRNA uridine-5-carboxymethylaminomethyl(34) synthesis GTPase MnmE [Clostridia bacterium]|nr:tRNA uridine-5-carboxymethylaminomethyl(34) synthesis GTPase MnmE [Clostridia bacterium]
MRIFTTTIAAISTPPGKGGVALIRVSGDEAISISERAFLPRSKKRISDYPSRCAIYGDVILSGEKIDDALLTVFRAPNSYTGEDTVEITCHGGVLITRAVLEALLAAGATAAGAGEFTRRAFLNGRLSLTEAEAIGDILEAKSITQIKLSATESRGRLADEIKGIRESLTTLLSSIYARIDYPDEDLGDFTDEETEAALTAIRQRIIDLKSTYRTGRSVMEGVRCAIVGKTNAGKSSLYNLLVGEDAAIVTEVEGTTRDVIERQISLGKVLLNLSDTAGIRDTTDTVERIGIERTLERLEDSELILAVFDLSRPFDERDEQIVKLLTASGKTVISVLNKCDTGVTLFEKQRLGALLDSSVTLSAKEGNAKELAELIDKLFTDERIVIGSDAIISSAKQNASLARALLHIDSALEAYRANLSSDVASFDIERALGAISELDGREVSEEIVNDIFSRFCVGK